MNSQCRFLLIGAVMVLCAAPARAQYYSMAVTPLNLDQQTFKFEITGTASTANVQVRIAVVPKDKPIPPNMTAVLTDGDKRIGKHDEIRPAWADGRAVFTLSIPKDQFGYAVVYLPFTQDDPKVANGTIAARYVINLWPFLKTLVQPVPDAAPSAPATPPAKEP